MNFKESNKLMLTVLLFTLKVILKYADVIINTYVLTNINHVFIR